MKFGTHIFLTCALCATATAGAVALAQEKSTAYNEGYEWARDNGIEDAHSCETEDRDFNDGCMAFINETKSATPTEAEDTPTGYDFPDDEMTVLE